MGKRERSQNVKQPSKAAGNTSRRLGEYMARWRCLSWGQNSCTFIPASSAIGWVLPWEGTWCKVAALCSWGTPCRSWLLEAVHWSPGQCVTMSTAYFLSHISFLKQIQPTLPHGLCTCGKAISLDTFHISCSLISFRLLLKCHLMNEVFLPHSFCYRLKMLTLYFSPQNVSLFDILYI